MVDLQSDKVQNIFWVGYIQSASYNFHCVLIYLSYFSSLISVAIVGNFHKNEAK